MAKYKDTKNEESKGEESTNLMSPSITGETNNFVGDDPVMTKEANKSKPSPTAPSSAVADDLDIPYSGLKGNAFVNNLDCKEGWKALLYNQKEIILARTIGFIVEAEHVLKVLNHPELFDTTSDPRYVIKGDCIVVVCKRADYDAMCLKSVKDWQHRNMPLNQSANITETLKTKKIEG